MDKVAVDNRREVDVCGRSHVREATIFDYGHIIYRHWRLVLLICIPAVVGTAVWSLVMTPTYQAQTSIVPPLDSMQRGSVLGGGLLSGMEGAFLRSALNVTGVADMYVGILESSAVADTLMDRFDLMKIYRCSERWRAMDRLRENTQIKVTKEGIVRISVVDRDPDRAAALANAYVAELDLQNKRLSGGQATSKRVFLENRLKEIEEKFSRIESLPSREALVQETLYELLTRECELAKIDEAKSMPTIQILDSASPPEHKFKPNRRMMVMTAAVGSFAMALLLAFFVEYRDAAKQDRGSRCPFPTNLPERTTQGRSQLKDPDGEGEAVGSRGG
jgi:uncharacterized protein involved in exopolysaccharide biosynthesis